MKRLLNTLFITTPDAYLALEGETVQVWQEDTVIGRFPLLYLEQIASFSYKGTSPQLMRACGERGIGLSFFSPHGRFYASVSGENRGNVLLRKKQYALSDAPEAICIARNLILGKVYNARWVLERTLRDHELQVNAALLRAASATLQSYLPRIRECTDEASLRGMEGVTAETYFSALPQAILQNRTFYTFNGRSRRPPLDPVNALLSFSYSMLEADCSAALQGVGLDPYVGFMHADRPGRRSLALDMMEELRPALADRFTLYLINNRILQQKDILRLETGACYLTEEGRKAFLTAWQTRKAETLTHPFLQEKLPWGLVPHAQALLLCRFLRGDLPEYPPFLWK